MMRERRFRISLENLQVIILAVITIAFALIAELLAPGFLRIGHLSFMLEVMAILGVVAIAQTIVIMTGGIDMSTGAIMYLMMAVAPMFMKEEFFLPFLLCLGIGALIGAINGALIAWAEIPPIVQTIAMMVALTGVVFVRTGGSPGGKAHPLLRAMTVDYVGPLHMATIIWFALTIIFFFILRATVYGRYIQALGSNPRASFLSGIRVKLVTFSVYVISGLLSAFGGLLFLGYIEIPYFPSQVGGLGIDYAFNSITATLIGGTLFKGGRGGPERTFLGVLLLQFLFSLLVMLGLPEPGKMIVQGIIIVAIVGIYVRWLSR